MAMDLSPFNREQLDGTGMAEHYKRGYQPRLKPISSLLKPLLHKR